jgi:hypothetical protein
MNVSGTRPRTFAAEIYTGLKSATALFIKRAFGNQALAAANTRVEQTTLSDYANTTNPAKAEHFMPVDILIDLIRASGDTGLLKHIAEQVDCLLVPLPQGVAGGALAERTGRSAKEFGDVMVRIGEAVRDGAISEAEARIIAAEIREAMLELSALAEAVKAATVRDEP